ncbi:hypothetical protein MB02_02530 [Croceicoccus estronivorus]|uniref:MFS transporter n=1 Tax=Croceicoccus estronivorus TaxID=1172626 RepID=UPI00083233F1|nr:MFS transporter [Croceicoccus estronivorus]OCC25529.1 hypothetical protein MB02_02530 [Croceicoccus estronivorus]
MEILGDAPEVESGVRAPRRGTAGVAAVCLGVSGLIALLFTGLSPALPSMAVEFGHGEDGTMIAQLVFSLAAVMMIAGALVAGLLSEMVGRRRVIIAGLLVYAIAGMGGMIAPNVTVLAITRAAAGFVSGMMLTATYATIGEYYEGDAREWMLGFISMFSSVVSVLLFVIGGMIVDWLGWRAMFGLFGIALLLVPPAWIALHHGRISNHPVPGGWAQTLRLWPLYLLIVVYTILIYMTAVQSPFLLTERGIGSATTIGLLLAVTSTFGAIGAFAYGFMRRHLGFAGMMAYASLTGGGGMIIAGVFPGMFAYGVAAVVIGMGIGIIEPTIASETLSRTPERLHDRAMGINLAAMFLGQFFNPLVMGPLRTTWGIADAFTIVGSAFLLAGGLFLVSLAGLARRRAAA